MERTLLESINLIKDNSEQNKKGKDPFEDETPEKVQFGKGEIWKNIYLKRNNLKKDKSGNEESEKGNQERKI